MVAGDGPKPVAANVFSAVFEVVDAGATPSITRAELRLENGILFSIDDLEFEGEPVVRPPAAPEVKDTAWARNPIDRFVLAGLEAKGWKPAPPAEPRALLRRVHLDLTGLPPTPQELDAFLADASGDAYEKQVERLLASPAYGERWGRHWLDAARYADSNGYSQDNPRSVWKYRDWVIHAVNADA